MQPHSHSPQRRRTWASNCSVRSLSSGRGKAATWASRSCPLLPMPTTLIAGRESAQPCKAGRRCWCRRQRRRWQRGGAAAPAHLEVGGCCGLHSARHAEPPRRAAASAEGGPEQGLGATRSHRRHRAAYKRPGNAHMLESGNAGEMRFHRQRSRSIRAAPRRRAAADTMAPAMPQIFSLHVMIACDLPSGGRRSHRIARQGYVQARPARRQRAHRKWAHGIEYTAENGIR